MAAHSVVLAAGCWPQGDASVVVFLKGLDGSGYDFQMSVPDARIFAEYIADSAEQATAEAIAKAAA